MPLRFSIYYPGSNLVFDVFIVSLISLFYIFKLNIESNFVFSINCTVNCWDFGERNSNFNDIFTAFNNFFFPK